MATNFPNSLDSYSTKQNNVDTIAAAHVNDLQDAVVALETAAGVGALAMTSWIPSLAFVTGTATWTFSSQFGSYVRVANMVFFTFFVTGTATWTTTPGQLRLTGLPITVGGVFGVGSNAATTVISVGRCSGFTTFPTVGLVAFNTTAIDFFRTSSSADTLTASHMTSGTAVTIVGQGQYIS